LVEEIVRSIYWFHPAVWWLLERIHLAREQSVDYEVVQLTGSKQPYLASLLEIARSHGRSRAFPAPLFLRERHLMERVEMLIKEVPMNRSRLAVRFTGIAVLLAGTIRLAAGWVPITGAPQIVRMQPAIVKILPPTPDSVTKIVNKVAAPKIEMSANTPAALMAERSVAVEVPVSREEPADTAQAAPASREPIKVGGNVMEAKLIHKVEPIYPELAKTARISGKVVLTVTVDEQGAG
jgi:hypothetical protein